METLEELYAMLDRADAAKDTEAAAAIMQDIEALEASSGAAPTPGGATAPGGGLPAPGLAGGGAPATPIAGPAGGPPAPAPGAEPGVPDFSNVRGSSGPTVASPTEESLLQSLELNDINPETGGNDAQNWWAGVGQSLDSNYRGAKMLGADILGMKDASARLRKEEDRARQIDKALLGTKAGRTGQIMGHVGQALIPGGAGAKGAMLAGGGLKAALATEMALGAAGGAIQPLAGDEKRRNNVMIGTALGGLGPIGGMVARAPRAILGATARKVVPRGTGFAADVAARMLPRKTRAASRAAGKRIDEIVRDVDIPLRGTPEVDNMMAKLAALRKNHGKKLAGGIKADIKSLQAQNAVSFRKVPIKTIKKGQPKPPQPKAVIPTKDGLAMDRLRQRLNSEGFERGGSLQDDLFEAQRAVSDVIDKNVAQKTILDAARKGGPKRLNELKAQMEAKAKVNNLRISRDEAVRGISDYVRGARRRQIGRSMTGAVTRSETPQEE